MAQLGTTTVAGRLGASLADGVDVGTALDRVWFDAGTVTFVPLVRHVTLPDEAAQIRIEDKVALVGTDGRISIEVDDLTEFVGPDSATHRVDYDAVSVARAIRGLFPSIYVRISGGSVNLAQVQAALVKPFVAQDVGLAVAAADRATAALAQVLLTADRVDVTAATKILEINTLGSGYVLQAATKVERAEDAADRADDNAERAALFADQAEATVQQADDELAALIAINGSQGLALDTDGTPYFDPALFGQTPTLALLIDTDGVPYLAGV